MTHQEQIWGYNPVWDGTCGKRGPVDGDVGREAAKESHGKTQVTRARLRGPEVPHHLAAPLGCRLAGGVHLSLPFEPPHFS